MTTYSVEPDADGDAYIWRDSGPHDNPDPITVAFEGDTDPVVFRAAAAVLAPDEAALGAVRDSLSDHALAFTMDGYAVCDGLAYCDWRGDPAEFNTHRAGAILAALRDRAVASDG